LVTLNKGKGEPSSPVDGHVHLHHLSFVPHTLDAARANFERVSGRREGIQGVLLLTQAGSEHVFEQLEDAGVVEAWRFERCANEPQTLIARQNGSALAIVCGRQVRARGGLEVLALGTKQEFADNQSFAETLKAVRASDGLPVLPWGFGKWLGKRGAEVQETLQAVGKGSLYVGDNASRLNMLGLPTIVRQSAQRGFRVLPGTDPFPFGGDYRRVGGFGFFAETPLDERAPWGSLKSWLSGLNQSPTPFGRALGPVKFGVNQFGIQIYNRFFRSKAR
jgi:hypothetical protein